MICKTKFTTSAPPGSYCTCRHLQLKHITNHKRQHKRSLIFISTCLQQKKQNFVHFFVSILCCAFKIQVKSVTDQCFDLNFAMPFRPTNTYRCVKILSIFCSSYSGNAWLHFACNCYSVRAHANQIYNSENSKAKSFNFRVITLEKLNAGVK